MLQQKNKPLLLIILDGWGLALPSRGNAVALAKKPVTDNLWDNYPHSILQAHGEAVGLPHGLVGNSEVGHMNLGAGRIIKQDLVRINEAIQDSSFFKNPVLLSAMQLAKSRNSNLHLMGLLSDGGIHSDIRHLFALLGLARQKKVEKVFIHAFTDGQDTPHKSALKYIYELGEKIKDFGIGKIASVTGRHYAMDRAHNWKRIEMVYNMLVCGEGKIASSAHQAIEKSYNEGLTDEFIEPTLICSNSKPEALFQNGDIVTFFNLRSDRARQLSKPFILQDFKAFKRKRMLKDLFFIGLTNFGEDLPMAVAFPESRIINALPEVLGKLYNFKQLYIAEEEKYAHVTYFFHGGTSIPFPGEKWKMIDSLDIKSYVVQPEMSAKGVTKKLLEFLTNPSYNFFTVNYANPDMLGHTGNLKAAIKGIEYVDRCVSRIVDPILKREGTVIITADHGNAEEMIDLETGEEDTRHSRNPVPFILVNKSCLGKKIKEGILADVSPTILDLLGVEQPKEMTGKSLVIK